MTPRFSDYAQYLSVSWRDLLVKAGTERLIGDIRVCVQFLPELGLNRRYVEADPIILARIPARRGLEVSTRRGRAVEDDVVLLARVPP